MNRSAAGCCVVALIAMLTFVAPGWAANLVINGDFETDTALWTTWPGYAAAGANPANITGWTGEGGRGINPVVPNGPTDAPFRDNGDNATSVAFLQGTAYIQQTIGLTVGSKYYLSLDYNVRNCCSAAGQPLDSAVGTILLNDVPIARADITPVGGNNPWYHAETEFVSPWDAVTLKIATAPKAGGDTTMLVDNVTLRLVPEPSSALLSLVSLLGLFHSRRRSRK